jgi:DUF1365 family protein
VVTVAPAIYAGTLRHRRFAPRPHQFEYALFMALLDIDRVPEAMSVSRLTGHNRWNWATFSDDDHLPAWPGSIRARLAASADAAGEPLPDGPIYLLTHLRYGGYVFNPISLFYCHDHLGVLRRVLAEVSNTYGGRRNYWLRPTDDSPRRFRAITAKTLYVSPFMEGQMTYEFLLTPPASTLTAHMNVVASAGPHEGDRRFDATLRLSREPWTAAGIRRSLMRFPLMTAQVMAAIHWEALRMRAKGLPIQPFPPEGPQ